MKVFGSKELLEDVFAREHCVSCGACVNLCPYFINYRGKTTQVFPCTLTVGRCNAYCPKVEVDLNELSEAIFGEPYRGSPMGTFRRVLTASAGDKLPKGNFQCGGTVSALAAAAIASGVATGAVLTGKDEVTLMPEPRLAETVDEVLACSSSKFTAAPTLSRLNTAASEGKTGLAVVATPCQATAVAQMRQNPTSREGFVDPASVVIGLFCTWAVDARKLTALVFSELGDCTVCRMDMPPPPSELLVVEAQGSRVEIPLAKVRPLIPKGCFVCPDMTSEWADVSVGVVEGIPDLNTLIIRTEAGEKLVDKACEMGLLKTEKVDQEKLAHLMTASSNKKKRAFTQMEKMGAVLAPDAEGRAIVRVRKEILERIMA
ncbi:MAG: Coenzyme F420 hydrogenase/dehydrogenase, beta subunit C-terminal domain [Thermodesulfobacteriota bacterium]